MSGFSFISGPHPVSRAVEGVLANVRPQRLLVGVSGGADSVALLHALVRHARISNLRLVGVHCNFHLRGEESDRDMLRVRNLCLGLKVPLIVVHFNVSAYIRSKGGSVEMACRELRYSEFDRIARSAGCDRICVAHNADDQVETLLLNLMRGAGVSGLRGMKEDNGHVLRPLLSVDRKMIENYLRGNEVEWIIDSTNMETAYRRNFLRHKVLPLLESRWSQARKSLLRTVSNMAADEKMLDWAENSLTHGSGTFLPYSDLEEAPDSFWLLRRVAARWGANVGQIVEMHSLFRSGPNRSGRGWSVPGGEIRAERFGFEFLPSKDSSLPGLHVISDKIVIADLPGGLEGIGLDRLLTNLEPQEILFRHPKPGDRIRPLGMQGSMAVSKVMKDARLSESQKRSVVVAESKSTEEVIWVKGLKRSRLALADPDAVIAWLYEVEEVKSEQDE